MARYSSLTCTVITICPWPVSFNPSEALLLVNDKSQWITAKGSLFFPRRLVPVPWDCNEAWADALLQAAPEVLVEIGRQHPKCRLIVQAWFWFIRGRGTEYKIKIVQVSLNIKFFWMELLGKYVLKFLFKTVCVCVCIVCVLVCTQKPYEDVRLFELALQEFIGLPGMFCRCWDLGPYHHDYSVSVHNCLGIFLAPGSMILMRRQWQRCAFPFSLP